MVSIRLRRVVLSFVAILALAMPAFAATGTLVPAIYQTVFDSNGNPVSGACIWTYVAGTSTPAATYSDVSLGTPNTDPIIADSAGRWTAWLTTGASYKFIVETACTPPAHGSVIRSTDNILAVPTSSVQLSRVEGRLTLTSGVPVPPADVLAATTLYFTPYQGNTVALYDGASWAYYTFTELSIAVPSSTSTMYDVFIYSNNGVPALETLAWTNDTTRAGALAVVNGVLTRGTAATRRYLGSFRTTTVSGQTVDAATARYLWNYYNRLRRRIATADATDTWAYSLNVYRQANNSTSNQVDVVIGVQEVMMSLRVWAFAIDSAAGTAPVYVSIGEDSTTAPTNGVIGQSSGASNAIYASPTALLEKNPTVGRHFYAWLERSGTAATTNWYGDNGDSTKTLSGMSGFIEG